MSEDQLSDDDLIAMRTAAVNRITGVSVSSFIDPHKVWTAVDELLRLRAEAKDWQLNEDARIVQRDYLVNKIGELENAHAKGND